MAYFEHEGCNLHYEEYGHGAPLLLVHGLGSSTLDWEMQIPALAAHYRVIVPDIRGHGRSDKPRERYSIAAFSADLLALIEHLRLGPVHYVGLSMGGMIGFQLAVDQPQVLKSLTIVNSAPQVKLRSRDDYWQWFKRWSLMRLLSLETIGKALGSKLFPKPDRPTCDEKWPNAGQQTTNVLISPASMRSWAGAFRNDFPGCPVQRSSSAPTVTTRRWR
ncbi:alpha/beta fold hydrolase [Pseudomonas triticicola]|uniref:alpha/beta fold hydrolase n=1 Tax=Pseudomonas triticicola TaxID=2842345 RepID=UPI003463767A